MVSKKETAEPIVLKKGQKIKLKHTGVGILQYSPVIGIPIRFTSGFRSKKVLDITGDEIIYEDKTREEYAICSP